MMVRRAEGKKIDGRFLAREKREQLRLALSRFPRQARLGIVYIGEHPVIENFIRYKQRFGEQIGVSTTVLHFSGTEGEEEIIASMKERAGEFDGMIVQLPVPDHYNVQNLLDAVPPEKDVDVLSQAGILAFQRGESDFFPPVVGAVRTVFESCSVSPHGENIVLLGYGKLVGKPMALWLEREGIPYTLLRSSHTEEERRKALRSASIIVSGVGSPGVVRAGYVKEGVILIDAGTSEEAGKLVGDIHPDVYPLSRCYTPVPGGIGPLTIAVLFENLLTAVQRKRGN